MGPQATACTTTTPKVAEIETVAFNTHSTNFQHLHHLLSTSFASHALPEAWFGPTTAHDVPPLPQPATSQCSQEASRIYTLSGVAQFWNTDNTDKGVTDVS
jgi:hypothetical protein